MHFTVEPLTSRKALTDEKLWEWNYIFSTKLKFRVAFKRWEGSICRLINKIWIKILENCGLLMSYRIGKNTRKRMGKSNSGVSWCMCNGNRSCRRFKRFNWLKKNVLATFGISSRINSSSLKLYADDIHFWQRHFITQMQSDILTCCKNPLNIVRFMSNMIAHIKRMFQQILEHFMVERIQFRCCVLHKPIFVLMWIERILRRCTANHNW